MPDTKTDLKNMPLAELTAYIRLLKLPEFRARQIFAWLYRPQVTSFTQMTDLSKDLREKLDAIASISTIYTEKIEVSQDGTRKFAFRLRDGNLIESVLIPEGERQTLCVSSQVGCAMGCSFCLTSRMGFTRNLSTAEIVNQVTSVNNLLAEEGKAGVNNLVFMGMGEPLANLDNLLPALEILIDQRGLDFSERKITVSTCGLVSKLDRFGAATRVNLAVSLHAANDQVRDVLMPVNKTYPLAELLTALKKFPLQKRKRIMIEYIMIRDVNDSDQDARDLVRILKGIPCKINLLPLNECPALPFRRPADARVLAFQHILWQADYTVLIRNSRGDDISAACGQLAGRLDGVAEEEEQSLEG